MQLEQLRPALSCCLEGGVHSIVSNNMHIVFKVGCDLGWGASDQGVLGWGTGYHARCRVSVDQCCEYMLQLRTTDGVGSYILSNDDVVWWGHACHSLYQCAVPWGELDASIDLSWGVSWLVPWGGTHVTMRVVLEDAVIAH